MTDKQQNQDGISRRQSLAGAAGLLAVGAAGVIGYELKDSAPARAETVTKTVTVREQDPKAAAATGSDAGVQTFVSRPDLRPPQITFTPLDLSAVAQLPPHILLATKLAQPAPDVQTGPIVLDRLGRLVYFQPETNASFDTQVQSYNGKSVLTYWTGKVIDGYGQGSGHIVGHDYKAIATIAKAGGLQLDLHELNLSSRGTAFVTAYSLTTADLSAMGGAKNGKVACGHAFEVDLKSGKVVWSWKSLDHVPITESYVGAPKRATTMYDYFHINSISETTDGNILISGRSCSALYKVDKRTGAIIWRLNGKKSDFRMGSGTVFAFQHHARELTSSEISVFDNGSMNPLAAGKRSRGMLLTVNESAKTVSLSQAYEHPAAFISATQGSVQKLANGEVFVGWGAQPYFSLFSASGKLLLDAEFPQGVRSYRAFTGAWTGTPDAKPTAVAKANGTGGFTVYASWNGATAIDHWLVLAGKNAKSLEQVGSQPWTGFETAIVVNAPGPSFQAVAVDANNKVIGRSAVI